MAPFSKAVDVKYALSREDGTAIYQGDVDGNWTIDSVPNGGYALALVVEASIQYQSSTRHRDPIHVTAHYMHTTSVAPFEVYVRTLKAGKGFSNIVAELVQEDRTRITTHIIFGVLTPPPDYAGPHLTLTPPSPYARRLPLYSHPSSVVSVPLRSTWNFSNQVRWAEDPTILQKNTLGSPTRTGNTTIGGGGVEWGAWFEFLDKDERVTAPTLAFLADIFQNMPSLLPKSQRHGLHVSWFPTMTLAIEFKFPIPTSTRHAQRTVGIYSSGRFMNDPHGRHDAYVEVWTAPSNIAEGTEEEGWRDKQVCLAVATQMALTLPIEVNRTRGRQKDDAKLHVAVATGGFVGDLDSTYVLKKAPGHPGTLLEGKISRASFLNASYAF